MDLINYTPVKPFAQKHLLTLQTYSPDEIYQVLSLALKLKDMQKRNIPHPHLQGKILAMIFAKSSTRTRVSFEAGTYQLGGHALFLNSNDIQLGRGEPISDTAKVLSSMVNGIMIRTFRQADVEELARNSTIPVINGLTDDFHPCQVLADLLTIYEFKGAFKGLKLAYIGDGNNMANSLLIGCSKVGMDISIACPKGYEPMKKAVEWAQENAAAANSKVVITNNPKEAIENADVVYTDVWASMGQEAEQEARKAVFAPYQVSKELFAHTKSSAVFMHCLPAHRNEEVTPDVIDSENSIVFEQAENRLHAQKALMVLLMADQH